MYHMLLLEVLFPVHFRKYQTFIWFSRFWSWIPLLTSVWRLIKVINIQTRYMQSTKVHCIFIVAYKLICFLKFDWPRFEINLCSINWDSIVNRNWPVGKMVLANALGFIFSLLETYLFIGVFYGWHEINRVLKVRIL